MRFKLCESVAYYNSKYFRSHAFKVRDDRDFLLRAFKANDTTTLDFMEAFYNALLKDRNCEKDIFSKNELSIVGIDENTEPGDFDELKKTRKNKFRKT